MAGPHCCTNPPALNPSSGEGRVEVLGGLKAYISGSSNSNLAIILITDAFGYEVPKLRQLADKVAAAGFYVIAPDFYHGEPFDRQRPVQDWLRDHMPDKGFEDAKPVIEALKSQGFSSIGAAGFCWGGKVVMELAKCNAVQATVPCHPSFITLDDVKGVNVPIAILAAETDPLTPPSVAKQFKEILNAKSEVDSYVEIFPKCVHGWTLRYEGDDEAKSAENAHKKMMDWFSKYLK